MFSHSGAIREMRPQKNTHVTLRKRVHGGNILFILTLYFPGGHSTAVYKLVNQEPWSLVHEPRPWGAWPSDTAVASTAL